MRHTTLALALALVAAALVAAMPHALAKPDGCQGRGCNAPAPAPPSDDEPEPAPDCLVDSYPWPSWSIYPGLPGGSLPGVRFHGFTHHPMPVCVALP